MMTRGDLRSLSILSPLVFTQPVIGLWLARLVASHAWADVSRAVALGASATLGVLVGALVALGPALATQAGWFSALHFGPPI